MWIAGPSTRHIATTSVHHLSRERAAPLRLSLAWAMVWISLLAFGGRTIAQAQSAEAAENTSHSAPAARVSLYVSADLKTIEGRFLYTLENTTRFPLERVELVHLGSHLKEAPAFLNDINHRWLYPAAFEGADARILELAMGPALPVEALQALPPARFPLEQDSPWMSSEAQRGLVWEPMTLPQMPEVLLNRPLYQLPVALMPGERASITGRFITKIPQRFGAFGRYNGHVTLEDAGLPLLINSGDSDPPALGSLTPMTFYVDVAHLRQVPIFVAGKPYDMGTIRVEARAPSLRMGPINLDRLDNIGLPSVSVGWMPFSGLQRELRFARTMRRALQALQAQHPALVEGVKEPVVFLQAPLRDVLTHPADGVVYFSDRLYRVSGLFTSLHDLELRYRLYQQLLARALHSREGHDASWLADGLAWWLAQHLQSPEERSTNIEEQLGWLTVIPIIDRLLHNPNYPMGASYARARYRPDLFRQYLASHVKGEPNGPVFLERLSLKLGAEALHQLINGYLEPGQTVPFRQWVKLQASEQVGFMEAWMRPFSAPNYHVEKMQTVAIEAEGELRYLNRIQVKKEGESPPEPLTVQIETRPYLRTRNHPAAENPTQAGVLPLLKTEVVARTLDMAGPVGEITLETHEPPHRITLDPEHLVDEKQRADNESPPRYNWLIWDALLSVNSSSQGISSEDPELDCATASCIDTPTVPDRFVSFLLNLRYKDTLLERNVWEFEGFRQVESLGGAFGYARYFGKKRTVYRWEHELAARLEFRQLRQAFEVENTTGNFAEGGSALTLRGGYSFENRMNPYTPIRGLALDVKGQVGMGLEGSADPLTALSTQSFGALTVDLRSISPISEVHTVAARVKLESFVWGEQVPVMNGFLLGGYGELRALPPRAELGQSKVLVSVEDRHPLWLDLDVNLLLFRVREARGVAFLDLGGVGERGFQGMTSDRFHVGLGYGLRFNIDLFGLSPLLCAIDLAVPVTGLLGTQPGAGVGVDFNSARLLVGSYHGF